MSVKQELSDHNWNSEMILIEFNQITVFNVVKVTDDKKNQKLLILIEKLQVLILLNCFRFNAYFLM